MILHIAERSMWEAGQARGEYRAPSLDSHGFIHCSLPSQATAVANRFYRGRSGLVLLCIDEQRVKSEIRYEEGEPGEHFPHLYGPLNLDAVVSDIDFQPNEAGSFELPASVTQYEK